MVLGKRVEGLRAEVAGEHWPAEGDDVAHGQQARLDSGEIAVAANQQRVALLAGNQSLPVDMRQQATGAVAAAHGEDDPVAAGQLGQLVNIGQPFMFSPGETLLPAGMTCWWATSCPACCRRSTPRAAACWLMQYPDGATR